MSLVEILDVTLRDGGYRNNFHFNSEELHNIIGLLDQSGVDYIEIGYRNGSLNNIHNIGITGLCPKNYLTLCRKLIKKSKMTVMLHPKNVRHSDLVELKECGVDLVRICVQKNDYENTGTVVEQCAKLGLANSVNLTRMSRYTSQELDAAMAKITEYPINMIYFADSNGSMLPNDLRVIYKKYIAKYNIDFGFHAHDNLGMAQANAVAAVKAGVKLIDVSLSGMGKGIGNLKTEFFIAYLHALGIKKYDLDKVRLASNYIRQTTAKNVKKIELNDFLMGIMDLTIDDISRMSMQNTLALNCVS